jgi:hypothetical protein
MGEVRDNTFGDRGQLSFLILSLVSASFSSGHRRMNVKT